MMSNYKKWVMLIGIGLIFILGFLFFNTSNTKNATNLEVENIEDDKWLGKGYGLQVNNDNSNSDSKEKGYLVMDKATDKLDVIFDNRGNNGKYILKVFYDYKEVEFNVDKNKKPRNSYIFTSSNLTSVTIPINLSNHIKKDNSAHNLTVSIFAAPTKHEKNIKGMTNFFGSTLNYELHYNKKGKEFKYNSTFEPPAKLLNVPFQGLMINTDFNNFSKVTYPPHVLKVKKGEKFKLAYRAGKYDNINEYLIFGLLNWKQWNIDDKPYKQLKIDSTKIGYGTLEMTAPKKAGDYEFVAYIVPAPFQTRNDFNYSLDNAYRFTIEVSK